MQKLNLTLSVTCLMLIQLIIASVALSQQTIPLYGGVIPNSTGYKMQEVIEEREGGEISWVVKTSVPTISIYLPDAKISKGIGVLIFPGGGYGGLSVKAEGTDIAKEFIRNGIAAFIVKYRLPSDSIMKDKSIGPLQDAQQAMKFVRENAKKYKVKKIGIIGFSAGGHLASTLGTHFNTSFIADSSGVSLRPDFMILVYPVISMQDTLAHTGSRTNLLGENPSDSLKHYFSNDEQVSDATPPTYITHAQDDKVVDIENSIRFYQALRRHHVDSEMHLYSKGDHGFVLHYPPKEWMAPVVKWIRSL
ncbi:MAG: alpha/beta hydrolase [Chitinophagaceae bacterium]